MANPKIRYDGLTAEGKAGSVYQDITTNLDSAAGSSGTYYQNGGAGVGQSFNREASAAQLATLTTAAVTSFTWPAGSRPTLAKIKPIGGAVWVCFDAPDAATALVWCQGASGAAVDSQRYLVPEYVPETAEIAGGTAGDYGIQPIDTREFPFTDGLSNMYILEYLTPITALIVEAS